MEKYRERLMRGQINPLVRWDGQTSGVIFDPAREDTPLTLLAFGALRLESGPHRLATGEREMALVPITGTFEVRIGAGTVYRGRRDGGVFAGLPETSNAFAIYAPAGADVEVSGVGEMVYFTAPARGHKPPAFVRPGDRENVTRGSGIWMRKVVTLFTPEDVSTVLVGGETYSPPGLWSGTPLHVHDLDDPAGNQSDHEEVYFHLARNTSGAWGPFSIQMLFDNQGLNNAYVVHDHDAFAIPGAAHPVVAGPNSDLLYIWALAGAGSTLKMMDVPEFAYLKKIGAVLDRLTAARPRTPLTRGEFDAIVTTESFTPDQAHVLRMHLSVAGIPVPSA